MSQLKTAAMPPSPVREHLLPAEMIAASCKGPLTVALLVAPADSTEAAPSRYSSDGQNKKL